MKPYGKKSGLKRGKIHSSDECGLCSNRDWKISKRRERRDWKRKETEQ